mgnify:CR=1 FL=1
MFVLGVVLVLVLDESPPVRGSAEMLADIEHE